MGFRFNPLTGTLDVVDGTGTGTVTSVALSVPAVLLSVSGSPVTTSGTLAVTLASQSANKVLASPNGSTGTPTFRQLVNSDISSGSSSNAYVLTSNGSGGTSWAAVAGGSSYVGATYIDSDSQDWTANATLVNFITSLRDSGSHVTNPTTAWRYTVGTGEDGFYRIAVLLSGTVLFNSIQGTIYVTLYKNGSNMGRIYIRGSELSSGWVGELFTAYGELDNIAAVAGDYFQIKVHNNGGIASWVAEYNGPTYYEQQITVEKQQ